MTIKHITKRNTKKKAASFAVHQDLFLIVNMALVFVFAVSLFYYVMVANHVASQKYSVTQLKDRIAEATETNSILASQKVEKENLDFIAQFAENHNMIKANNSPYLFESNGVALSR